MGHFEGLLFEHFDEHNTGKIEFDEFAELYAFLTAEFE